MTKSELIDVFSSNHGITKPRAEQAVNAIFESMSDALKRGDSVEIRGLGRFSVRTYSAYNGRNPRTGESVRVASKRSPFFKVGKGLKEMVEATITTDTVASSQSRS